VNTTEQPGSAVLAYETAIARVLVLATSELGESVPAGTGVAARRVVNHVRGNQPPVAETDATPPRTTDCRGALHDHSARWIARGLERLAEEGYLERVGDRTLAYAPTAAGRRLARGRERLRDTIFPRPARLGDRPELESRLAELRRRLASEEGRPAFSIFDNRTLAWIAAHQPHTLADLADAPGFGEQRLASYGRRVLRALEVRHASAEESIDATGGAGERINGRGTTRRSSVRTHRT